MKVQALFEMMINLRTPQTDDKVLPYVDLY